MMNDHGDTHQKASIYVKNDLNDDWMYRVTNLTRNTPALCAGNLGGNIHQTSFSTIDITIVAIVHLITDLTWDVAALLSLNLVTHLPTHFAL